MDKTEHNPAEPSPNSAQGQFPQIMDTLPGFAEGRVRNHDYIKVIVPSMALMKEFLNVFVYLVVPGLSRSMPDLLFWHANS